MQIATGKNYPINKSKVYKFVKPDRDKDYIGVGGHLYEDDGVKSENLGYERTDYTLSNLPKGPIEVTFAYENTRVTVFYEIKPLF